MVNGSPQPEAEPVPSKPQFGIRGAVAIYVFDPQPDINAQETAGLLPFFTQGAIVGVSMKLLQIMRDPRVILGTPESVDALYESMPKGVQRHLRKVAIEKPVVVQAKRKLQLPPGAK